MGTRTKKLNVASDRNEENAKKKVKHEDTDSNESKYILLFNSFVIALYLI